MVLVQLGRAPHSVLSLFVDHCAGHHAAVHDLRGVVSMACRYVVTGMLGVSMSYHRQLSHKSFRTPKVLSEAGQQVFILLSCHDHSGMTPC